MIRLSKTFPCLLIALLSSGALAGPNQSFEQSKQLWQKIKKTSPLFYQFSTEFESWTGSGETTTMTVLDDSVMSRSYRRWTWYYDYENNSKYTRKTEEFWLEGPTQVGQHDQGESPKTLDQIYDQCEMQILSLDPAENQIEFTVDSNGLIEKCRARNIYCADDCWEGTNIVKLKVFNNSLK